MNTVFLRSLIAAAAFGLSAPLPAFAGDEWTVTLGASMIVAPRFPGAESYGSIPVPTFDIRRFGTPEARRALDDNPGFVLWNVLGVEIGPVAGFREDRSASEAKALAGLPAIDWDIDAGVFLQHWAVPDTWRFRTEIRQAVSNGSGLVVDVGSDWFVAPSDDWLLSAGIRATFADRAYMRTYFGATPGDAAQNGQVSSFDASGGLESVGVTASASYKISPDWTVQIFDRFDRLVGDAADSPITAKFGDTDQNIVGITLNKRFRFTF